MNYEQIKQLILNVQYQANDTFHQIIVWNGCVSLLYFILSLVCGFALYLFIDHFIVENKNKIELLKIDAIRDKEKKEEIEHIKFYTKTLRILSFIVIGIFFIISLWNMEWVKIFFFPKVYLVQYMLDNLHN